MKLKNLLLFCLVFPLVTTCNTNADLLNCIRTLPLNLGKDLNNPDLINAQTPGGHALFPGGNRGILLFNKNGNDFVAFDRLCPANDCDQPMTFEGRLLKCSCDDSAYSVDFGGAPQTEGFLCPAIEYRVIKNGSSLRITNF
ncbi:MAG: phosphoribosylaminoimidazole carboxylase [Flavobacteriaceae bacterium]|nr:phosphoribosylaminoimidazole carboxylase [Flavobacteriaceae bacterium]|tara:strand:+ start:118742 stop:119164 length:423 start_codon:yes stop_codon:yes gene_type:complete